MTGNAISHLFKYYLGFEKPASQTTQAERTVLKKYSEGLKTAVEIGVFEGVNTTLIASSLAESGILYGIDPFFKGKLGVSYHELIAKKEIDKRRLSSKVKFLSMLSFDAVEKVPNDLDFVFIDGDHTYDGVKKDWEDWSSKLKVGGIMAIHDTSVPAHDPSVAELGSFKYFNEVIKFDKRFTLLETQDSLNILEKKF